MLSCNILFVGQTEHTLIASYKCYNKMTIRSAAAAASDQLKHGNT